MTNTLVNVRSDRFEFRTYDARLRSRLTAQLINVFAIATMKGSALSSVSVAYGVLIAMIPDGDGYTVTIKLTVPSRVAAVESAIVIMNAADIPAASPEPCDLPPA